MSQKQQPSTAVHRWVSGFLIAKRAEGLAPGTLARVYGPRVRHFADWLTAGDVLTVEAITPEHLRQYILTLAETHNPGGVHSFYRVVKTFLRWYELEAAAPDWRNPITRVPAPRLTAELLEPVTAEAVRGMLGECGGEWLGLRDAAMLRTLYDTGLRAGELLALDVGDFDQYTGALSVRKGKGGKGRVVFAGQRARRALRAWLREHGETGGPLFVSKTGGRLTYYGLRSIIVRLARSAQIKPPSLHSFRRAFALESLRAGMDPITLSRLMGHAGLTVLQRYLKQTTNDLQAAHAATSPVDRAGLS